MICQPANLVQLGAQVQFETLSQNIIRYVITEDDKNIDFWPPQLHRSMYTCRQKHVCVCTNKYCDLITKCFSTQLASSVCKFACYFLPSKSSALAYFCLLIAFYPFLFPDKHLCPLSLFYNRISSLHITLDFGGKIISRFILLIQLPWV